MGQSAKFEFEFFDITIISIYTISPKDCIYFKYLTLLQGVTVEVKPNSNRPASFADNNTLEWAIRMENPITFDDFEVAAETREEALEWAATVRETGQSASHREDENRKKERTMRIARELSKLVIYCR